MFDRFRRKSVIASFVILAAGIGILLVAVPSCTSHVIRGGVNGVEYDMSLDREAVAGGVPWSIDITMHPDDPYTGTLMVDGISFGTVRAGDRVRVDDEATVFVNDRIRSPAAEPIAEDAANDG